MKQPEAVLREEASWSRRTALSRWLTRFRLRWQWSVAALAWSVLTIVAYAVDLAFETGESSIGEIVVFGLWLVPGAVMVTLIAARNTWVRVVNPERFERDRGRARYPEFRRYPTELSPALHRKVVADWDIRGTQEY